MANLYIEECIQQLTAIREKIHAGMPDVKMWQVVDSNTEDEASITLCLGLGKSPAFGVIDISCYDDGLEVQVQSAEFGEEQFPKIAAPEFAGEFAKVIAKLTDQRVSLEFTEKSVIDARSAQKPSKELKLAWAVDEFDFGGEEDSETEETDEQKNMERVFEKVTVLRQLYDQLTK